MAAEWEDVRAIMVSKGDMTPAGVVEGIESHGDLHVTVLTVSGVDYTRGFDELVSRKIRHS
jgi:hypothetical protein